MQLHGACVLKIGGKAGGNAEENLDNGVRGRETWQLQSNCSMSFAEKDDKWLNLILYVCTLENFIWFSFSCLSTALTREDPQV